MLLHLLPHHQQVLFCFVIMTALDKLCQHAQLVAAVMAENGKFLLLITQGRGIIIDILQLVLHLHRPLFRPHHQLNLTKTALNDDNQEDADNHEHAAAQQRVNMNSRQIEQLRVQIEVAHTAMIIRE